MTMNDPIADMLTRIRNANVAMHDEVKMPSSKLKQSLATILQSEGYIEGFSIADTEGRPGQTLTVTMKYSPERDRTISGLRRVSKPGLRVYSNADKVPRVLGGLGVAIVSTSHGLMTDREARSRKVGGEILCFVRMDTQGRIARFFPRDPSWFSWLALERLIHGNIVPDFPVCNKSVNASYSGHGL